MCFAWNDGTLPTPNHHHEHYQQPRARERMSDASPAHHHPQSPSDTGHTSCAILTRLHSPRISQPTARQQETPFFLQKVFQSPAFWALGCQECCFRGKFCAVSGKVFRFSPQPHRSLGKKWDPLHPAKTVNGLRNEHYSHTTTLPMRAGWKSCRVW